MNIKNVLYKLVFASQTNPTKFMLGTASIGMFLVQLLWMHSTNLFYVLFLLYGIGMFWRIVDVDHRKVPSCVISTVGSFLWSHEAWTGLLSSEPHTQHIVTPIIFALASLWLLIRSGSGEIITKKLPCTDTAKHKCPFIIQP